MCDVCVIFAGYKPWVQSEVTDLFVIIVCYPGDLCVMLCYIYRLQAVGTERSDLFVIIVCYPGDLCVMSVLYLQATSRGYRAK